MENPMDKHDTYEPPTITVAGTLEEITKASNLPNSDAIGPPDNDAFS